jgi:hypothetical protein
MSYCRSPYIYPTKHGTVWFESVGDVPSEHINIFLYKMMLSNRRDELKQRLQEGRSLLVAFNKDDHHLEWLNEMEDEFIKGLLK